ncbi:Alpha/Beta hydrolase protein [Xylogone sp. PMI_703]|nr:Alpha/Beta hydrolase protein [Xylogone sp. PMI_703]
MSLISPLTHIEQESVPSFTWPKPATYIYKTVGSINIEVDVEYLSDEAVTPGFNNRQSTPQKRPILLWIHGGGWIGSIRNDYPRPLIYDFLQRGFVITSIDYRLLPESDFLREQVQDVVDVEAWLRGKLPLILEEQGSGVQVDTERIAVAGGSAGSLLAAFTPKLWKSPPKALLLIYVPTNMFNVRFLEDRPIGGDRLKDLGLELPKEASPDLISEPRKSIEDFMSLRSILGLVLFRKGLVPEFLLRGIIDGEEHGSKRLPEKGCVTEEEIKEISPIYFPDHLFADSIWPPTYQYIGSMDEAFEESHVITFDEKLKKNGIPSKAVVVDGKSHAFDMESQIGDEIHKTVISPAADWIIGYV